MKRLVIFAVAVVLLPLAGCKGDSNIKATTVGEATTTTAAGTDEDTGGDTEQSAELASSLLTIGDLPTGYSPSDDEDDDSDEDDVTDECEALRDYEDRHKADEEAEVSFQKGEPSLAGFGVLSEGLGRFKTSSAARQAFDTFAAGLPKCTSFDSTDDDGTKTHFEFTPLSFPKLGDGTFAAHIKAKIQSPDGFNVDASGDMVVVRVERTMVLLFAFGFGSGVIPANELETVARKAVSKI